MTDTGGTRGLTRKSLSGLAWPLVSIAAVIWSFALLFAKLEAEVSADPVIKAALDDGSVTRDAQVVAQVLLERLGQIPTEALALSGFATLVAYAALALYDRIALMHLGRLGGISWRYVALCSFVTYALGHNLGASVVSGGAVRLRAYTAKGLTKIEVGALIGMCTLTFVLGTALLLGLVFLFAPDTLEPLGSIFPEFVLPVHVVRGLGAMLLGMCALYVLSSALGQKTLKLGPLRVSYPGLPVVIRQVVVAPLEIVAAAGIIYFALPEAGNPGFVTVVGAFVISFSVGLISQVPGGVGVMEAVFLALMPSVGAASVVAALLVWRLFYLLIPLALSGPIVLAFERSNLTGSRT